MNPPSIRLLSINLSRLDGKGIQLPPTTKKEFLKLSERTILTICRISLRIQSVLSQIFMLSNIACSFIMTGSTLEILILKSS